MSQALHDHILSNSRYGGGKQKFVTLMSRERRKYKSSVTPEATYNEISNYDHEFFSGTCYFPKDHQGYDKDDDVPTPDAIMTKFIDGRTPYTNKQKEKMRADYAQILDQNVFLKVIDPTYLIRAYSAETQLMRSRSCLPCNDADDGSYCRTGQVCM